MSTRFASIQVKVFAVIFALTATIVVVLTAYFSLRQIASSRSALEQKALTYGRLGSHEVEPAIAFEDRETAREVFAAMRSDPDIRSLALYSGQDELLHMDGRAQGPRPPAVTGPTVRRTKGSITSITPVVSKEGPRGTLVIELSTAALEAERASIQKIAIGAGAVMLVAGFIASWLIGRSLGRRLRAVADAATRVASGDLAAPKLDASSADEVGQLAGSFNVMVSNVESLMAEIAKMAAEETTRLDDLVKLRTAELDARNADMKLVLANVGQGLVTLDRDGSMGVERSAVLEAWLGPAAPSAKLWEYLATVDAEVAESFAIGWEMIIEDVFPLEVVLQQLPRRMIVRGRHLSLDYRPILAGETLSHLLVVVSDVSDQVERERADAAQREILSVFERITRDRVGFRDFFADATDLVQKVTTDPGADLVVRKRWIHTLKGNAAVFGVASVAELCHDLETRMTEQGGEPSPADLRRLTEAWSGVTATVEHLLGNAKDTTIEITNDDHEAAIQALSEGAPPEEMVAMLASWRLESAERRLDRIAEQARSLARRLQKGDIAIAIDPGSVRFPSEGWTPFWAAFAHVVRNAIDHGLEAPEDRVARGKSPAGKLSLRTHAVGDTTVIELTDDGRGVDWERLRSVAREAGLPSSTREDLVAAMLHDGVTTRDSASEYSGRGVGMGAVAAECAALGGTMELESKENEGTRIRFRIPRASTPPTSRETKPRSHSPAARASLRSGSA